MADEARKRKERLRALKEKQNPASNNGDGGLADDNMEKLPKYTFLIPHESVICFKKCTCYNSKLFWTSDGMF